MNDLAAAVSRSGEAASIAVTMLIADEPGSLSDAFKLVYGEVIAAVEIPPMNQHECPVPPCPALSRAVGTAIGALQGVTGVIAVELLAGLMVALRRLSELEGISPAQVVQQLVAGIEEGAN
ncbi:MAG: hypothetical protein JWO98_2250 [Frankiales bacterium]|nr:hypothetical protein [Frankiales bacterium]